MSNIITKVHDVSLGYDLRYQILKEYLDLESLLLELGIKVTRKTPTELMASCPFHNDKHPSWSINRDQSSPNWGFFNCFVCKKGNVVSLVKLIHNISYFKALKWLEEFAGIEDLESLTFDAVIDRRTREVHKEEETVQSVDIQFPGVYTNQDAIEYLLKRGLSQKQIQDRDVRVGTGQYSGRVVFPIRNQFGITSFYARTFTGQMPKGLYPKIKGAIKNSLYGYEKSDFLVNWCYLVEGCFDVLSIERMLLNVYPERSCNTFATLGPILHKEQAELLKYWSNIVIIPDMKGNAESLVPTCKELLQNHNLYLVTVDKDEDPDSMRAKYPDKLLSLLANPEPLYNTKVQFLVDYGE